MSEIEIKAQMFDLITQKDQIEFDLHNELKALELRSNELKQNANIALKPIVEKLTELHNKLNKN